MTRGVALAATPARRGRRAGQLIQPREVSHARACRAIIAAIRAGRTCYGTLTRQIARYRVIVDRNRHSPRKSKSPSSFPRAAAKSARTRTATAVIIMANQPA
jgi:hypothetical protein